MFDIDCITSTLLQCANAAVIRICLRQLHNEQNWIALQAYHIHDSVSLQKRNESVKFPELIATHDGVKQVVSNHVETRALKLAFSTNHLYRLCYGTRQQPRPVQNPLPAMSLSNLPSLQAIARSIH
jgi:hypothetical protein